MAGLFTNDSNQYGGIKVSVIGYAQVDEALSQLRQIDRDRAVQAGLKAGAAYLVRRGRQRLRKGLKTDAYHRHYQKGNLMKSFVARVKKSKAGKKDQSYVLWNIPKNLIEHVIFPLGNFESKDEIRKIANDNELKVASKPDSEDICFIPDGDYAKFLEINSDLEPSQGNIVHVDGRVLGKHNGLYHYTIGQRKGLGISYKEPLFVIGFNRDKNEVVVGEKEYIYKQEMIVRDVNLLLFDEINEPLRVSVKTRYSSNEEPALIEMIDNDRMMVRFDSPVARITPGQSAVFYIGDIVVGGGKIC